MNYTNLIVNTLINSLLEEGFVYGFALHILILLRVLEFEKRKFFNLIVIGVPVSAAISNILRIFISDINVTLLIMVAITIITLVLTQKIHIKQILKVISAVFCSIVILQVTEIYILEYLNKSGETVDTLKQSALLSFYISLPERLIQYLILGYAYASRLDTIKVEFTKVQKRVFGVMLFFSFVYYCGYARLLLTNAINIEQFTLIILTAVPMIFIWMYYCYTYFKNRRIIIREKYNDVLEKALNYRIIKLKMK